MPPFYSANCVVSGVSTSRFSAELNLTCILPDTITEHRQLVSVVQCKTIIKCEPKLHKIIGRGNKNFSCQWQCHAWVTLTILSARDFPYFIFPCSLIRNHAVWRKVEIAKKNIENYVPAFLVALCAACVLDCHIAYIWCYKNGRRSKWKSKECIGTTCVCIQCPRKQVSSNYQKK